MEQTETHRLHIVEGTDWKDAIIALLDDRSPYRPWRYGFGEAHEGDPVAIVLDTDPPSVMTALGRVGADGRTDRAAVQWPVAPPSLLDLATLAVVVGFATDEDPRDIWQLRDDAAIRMELALTEFDESRSLSMCFGHSSVVAARVLLYSGGICTGCDDEIDLAGVDARDHVHIRTVEGPQRQTPQVVIKDESGVDDHVDGSPRQWWSPYVATDWPGVLCSTCHSRFRDGGYTSLLDFRFSRNPKCPHCFAQRTREAMFGLPVSSAVYCSTPLWVDWRGCCVDNNIWSCAECGHQWG